MAESFEFFVRTSTGTYVVRVGKGVANEALQTADTPCLIDAHLLTLYPHLANAHCVPQTAQESAKNLDSVGNVIERLRDLGAHRQSHLVAIGGGIVQDVATFAASSYMRGISWTYCPTTLLGMVDSCIGGKSSLNVGRYKNIAGNFYPPQQVLVDTDFCSTLSLNQKVEGLLEAVKICYAESGDAFARYLSLMPAEAPLHPSYDLVNVIALSLKTKKSFIEKDEFDNDIRQLLNFGHTFGHALEGASGFSISHGIAVGLGMLAALHFSETQGLIDARNPRAAALAQHIRKLFALLPGLAEKLADFSIGQAMSAFMSDKKHTSDSLRLILFDSTGHLFRHHIPHSTQSHTSIQNAFAYLKSIAHEI